jgi:hypothetical protein
MIDTVILSIPTTKIIVLDESAHGVLPWDLQARGRGFEKYVKNPSERDKASGLYFPRLTGYKRGSTKMVKIEFSAPKLLFNNNLDELADKQFAAVIDALQDRLVRLAVRIQQVDLERADVAGVHYSKNVELTGGYTSEYVIGELGKINLNKRFDLTRARYMNDGQSLCAYSTSHSFVIYDKVADLKRGSKRAIDREQTDYQMSLFAPLKKAHEILRFEVRLSQRRKMINVLKTLGLGDNPTFRDVFSVKTSQAVLMHYWDTMIEKNSLLLFAHSLTPKDLLKQTLLARPSAKGKTAIYLVGLLLLAREGNGLRELRAILAKRSNDRLWYRLRADLTETTAGLNKLRPREWFDQVKAVLKSYQPFRLPSKE